MDPLTAIGLVSNILSFIDFGARLLKGAKEVHDSQHGVLEENRNRETIIREMQRISTRMSVSKSPENAADESSLCTLASECRQLSTQLISLLEKIKPEDSDSKTQSLLSAIRNKVHESERTSLEVRLSDCRAQLHLELSSLTSTETLTKLESLVQASRTDETKLDRIESQVAQLREVISSISSASEAKPMLLTLLAEQEKVFTLIAQGRILNCLSYEGMNRRSNMVVETHANTYEWILEDDPMDDKTVAEIQPDSVAEKVSNLQKINEDIEKARARDKLKTWLESESSHDVFHLSGKLGSGKSTLMKHIRASPRTKEKLTKWADGRKLTIANFYFWNIGSDDEKSLRGLYRSLLYQILTECPEVMPTVMPIHWAEVNIAPWVIPVVTEISDRDVIEAFERVTDSHDVLNNHCFAFFIDGLDEFQSTVQNDHRDLVRLLVKWAAGRSGNIKICVSSREYPVFMDGFSSTLRIRFHDLTRRDTDIYIRDKLAHASSEEDFETLVSSIMSKADGVFLWVALVVKSLREGLENGLSCSDLIQEVDVLPDQLESLYKHILLSLGRSARRKAYQVFAMVAELKKTDNYRMSLLAYSFFEEYEAGENFFMKENRVFPMTSLTGDCGRERARSTSRRLAGWCKGLVELYKSPMWVPDPEDHRDNYRFDEAAEDWSMELDFAHRSISDFLESDEVQRDMQLNLRRFDHVDAIVNLIVSDILFESSASRLNTPRAAITSAVSLQIVDHHDLARPPFTYFNRVRELLAATKPNDSMASRTVLLMSSGKGNFWCAAEFMGNPKETSSNGGWAADPQLYYISDPLYRLTFLGPCDYPLWSITNNPGLVDEQETILSLACLCLEEGSGKGLFDGFRPLMVLEGLLERGWVSPATITNYRVVSCTGLWSSSELSQYFDITLWHQFLIKMLSGRYHPKSRTMHPAQKDIVQQRLQRDGKLLQLFLRFKPETEVSFEICVNEETTTLRRDFLPSLGKHGPVLKLRTNNFDGGTWERPWEDSEIGLPAKDDTPAIRHVSLREFIEFSSFDNKTEILEMLDRQLKSNIDDQQNTSTATTLIKGKEDCTCGQIESGDEAEQMNIINGTIQLKRTNSSELYGYLERVLRWIKSPLRNEYVRLAVAALMGVLLTMLFIGIRERLGESLSV